MNTLSLTKVTTLALVAFVIAAMFAMSLPHAASAYTDVQTQITQQLDKQMAASNGRLGGQQGGENRDYSVAGIRTCVSANVPSDTSSSTASISKAKGDALIACIKNARVQSAVDSAIAELLKKIEDIKKQIAALKKQ